MAKSEAYRDEEAQPLTTEEPELYPTETEGGRPRRSESTASTTSLVLEHLTDHHSVFKAKEALYDSAHSEQFDIEDNTPWHRGVKPVDKKARQLLWIACGLLAAAFVAALFFFVGTGSHKPLSSKPHDPHATSTPGNGHKVTLDQVLWGQWYPRSHAISWIDGANGEDGLMLQRGEQSKDYLVVEDVQYIKDAQAAQEHSKTLMKEAGFWVGSKWVVPHETWPSPDLKKVLVQADYQKNWRHSNTATYWIFDVASQSGQPLDPSDVEGRVQLAEWSPKSDAVVFTRGNNLFYRKLTDDNAIQITTDGGAELFYGVPDWVYEEEVFGDNKATWMSEDGNYIAFLRTDESAVPEYPVQYFFSRPSGQEPKPGEENYPEVRQIKYPKAGAPMSVVNLLFYDLIKKDVFSVNIENDFADDDRLITEVLWAGTTGKVLIRETNRESDVLKVILVDATNRSGKTVRETDIKAIDGGWFEVSEDTTFIPADPTNGRPHDGYVDTVIHEGYDHLAYFTPLDNAEPVMLTSGKWEVVNAPSAIDLKNNLVYFVSTEKSSIERHIYSVKLDGTSMKAITDDSEVAYYSASFSKKGGYALLTNKGPGIPWQKVISTPNNAQTTDITIEENKELASLASKTELPILKYQTVTIDGYELNLVERRPPHFDEKKKYPVLFYLYNGPGFQEVDRTFKVNFQSYVASSLGYIVVTLDGRGTGFLGRDTRCIVRGNIGYWEAHDQIAAAKMWAAKSYVDADRMAIWGWSYGGFMTLKTLEQDAGETFKYGMSVAPVTDWRYYDSIYTERYMYTPQHNPAGYDNATVSNVTALSQNVRFLVMHGVADDNVHMQNTLSLLDKLDLGNVRNYDVHIFPDSDHSIYFHNANRVVFEKLSTWLINAFNGEWLRAEDPVPIANVKMI